MDVDINDLGIEPDMVEKKLADAREDIVEIIERFPNLNRKEILIKLTDSLISIDK